MTSIRECPPAGAGGRGDDGPAVGPRERPILFSGPMVQALLAGTKTQTRRVVKVTRRTEWLLRGDWADSFITNPGNKLLDECPYGTKGDRLWVKEAWAYRLDMDHLNGTELYDAGVREAWYWADGPGRCCNTGCNGAAGRVRAARFMPRWASRITLEITEVRVQRLQEISEADAIAEGCRAVSMHSLDCDSIPPSREFAALWDSINGAGSWSSNPWVWAISFRRVTP